MTHLVVFDKRLSYHRDGASGIPFELVISLMELVEEAEVLATDLEYLLGSKRLEAYFSSR